VRTGEAGEVLPLCRRERPSLLLADRRPEHVALCRAIRSDADPALRETPICIVADAEDPVRAADEAAAGVTDWLYMTLRRLGRDEEAAASPPVAAKGCRRARAAVRCRLGSAGCSV